jgi:uncharacterized damage-inducible protein DinB
MTIAQSILPEFDHEMATTRSLLERVPDAQPDWKPHTKSMPLGGLAIHLANIPSWSVMTLTESELDFNPPGGTPWEPPKFESTPATLKTFDQNVANAREVLAATSDEEIMQSWTLKNGGQILFTLPRVAVLRSFVMNHIIHHRGQLSVYLRLLDVPLPSIYGPTADTPM